MKPTDLLMLETLFPIHLACTRADLPSIKAQLDGLDTVEMVKRVNQPIELGLTPLHVLFLHTREDFLRGGKRSVAFAEVLEYLLECGAKLDAYDHLGRRPACLLDGDTPPAVRRLLEVYQAKTEEGQREDADSWQERARDQEFVEPHRKQPRYGVIRRNFEASTREFVMPNITAREAYRIKEKIDQRMKIGFLPPQQASGVQENA